MGGDRLIEAKDLRGRRGGGGGGGGWRGGSVATPWFQLCVSETCAVVNTSIHLLFINSPAADRLLDWTSHVTGLLLVSGHHGRDGSGSTAEGGARAVRRSDAPRVAMMTFSVCS